MRPCINQDTLKTTPTDTFLRIAKQSGFEAVELTIDKVELIIAKEEVGKLRKLIQEQGLDVVSINGPESFNLLPKNAFSSLLERTRKLAAAAQELGCELLVPVPSVKTTPVSNDMVRETAEALNALADACGDDVRLGLEFLGTEQCSINNLTTANEVVSLVGRDNVGLVLDSFHMHLSGTPFTDIAKVGGERVFLVHVNDSERGDRTKLADANRLFPGEGVIDLEAFRSNLTRAGYDGYVSLELLKPSYWEQDPQHIARMGRESLKRTFGI